MILSRRSPSGISIKSAKEIEFMRRAGQIVADTKVRVKEAIRPGVTTGELDRIAEDYIRSVGAMPSFKGYKAGGNIPFSGTICASVNEEIVHGIPGNRVLNEGDILSVDFGAIAEGFHGDSAFTMGVGEISEEAQRLIDATRESLKQGIAQVKAGGRISDISHAVQTYAEGMGFSVVRQYVGHGIGRALHEEPQVPNYGEAGRGPMLKKGMTIAIEPMLNIGGWETEQLDDGWTVVTADGSLSAHFEDTIAITQDGAEVLTSPEGYYF
ncbi:MAG: type I methionyl aminopeptidase [SAR202 cluster bacterium Casp-Chloro-G4]|nr:type I methionyl aminopeptidase [Chloroflexota bacterium]PKB61386.1 MAG: type I methionyl aminopeptidase [SAR202 cluster bacterium Casp-Chloro-G4]